MAPLAAFAQSDRGRTYAAVCQRFGVDPAAGFGDDVLAYNLRLALTHAQVEEHERREALEGDDPIAATRRMEEWIAQHGPR